MNLRDESGQAITEYILMLAIVIAAFLAVTGLMSRLQFAQKLTAPISGEFMHVYQYGHPQALGYDDGGPKNHPRAVTDPLGQDGNGNFRIFLKANQH